VLPLLAAIPARRLAAAALAELLSHQPATTLRVVRPTLLSAGRGDERSHPLAVGPQARPGVASLYLDAEEASFLLADRQVSQRHLFVGRARHRTHLCQRPR